MFYGLPKPFFLNNLIIGPYYPLSHHPQHHPFITPTIHPYPILRNYESSRLRETQRGQEGKSERRKIAAAMATMAAMVAAAGMTTVPLPMSITPPPSSSPSSSSLFAATVGAPGAATVQPKQFRHGRRHVCRAQEGEQESQMAQRVGSVVIPLLAAALAGQYPGA